MAFQVPPLWQAAFSLKHLLAQKWAKKWTLWVVLNLVWTNCGISEVSPCWSHSHELFDLWRRWWGLCLNGNRHGSCAPGLHVPLLKHRLKGLRSSLWGRGTDTPTPHLHSWRASARDSSVGEALMSFVVGWMYYGMLSCAQFHALLSNQMSLCFSSIGSDHVKFPMFILHLHPSWWSKQYSWRYGYSQVWWAFFIIPMSSSLTGLWCFLQKGRTGQELIPLICPHFVSRALVNSLDPHVWYGNRVVCCRAAWNFAFSLTRLGVTAQSCVVPVLLTL